MTHKENPFLDKDQVGKYPLEILVDQNLRKDGIIQPLDRWPTAHLLHLQELLNEELDQRP